MCHTKDEVRALTASLADVARERSLTIRLVRDAGTFVRAHAEPIGDAGLSIDIVYEGTPDLEAPPPPMDGVVVESLTDLRAAKLTGMTADGCGAAVLSRPARRPLQGHRLP